LPDRATGTGIVLHEQNLGALFHHNSVKVFAAL